MFKNYTTGKTIFLVIICPLTPLNGLFTTNPGRQGKIRQDT